MDNDAADDDLIYQMCSNVYIIIYYNYMITIIINLITSLYIYYMLLSMGHVVRDLKEPRGDAHLLRKGSHFDTGPGMVFGSICFVIENMTEKHDFFDST